LKDQYGIDLELYKNLEQFTLLVFYPKDNTPVCTKQLNDYTKNLNLFEEVGIRIIGVNTASSNSHREFCKNLSGDILLVVDEDKKVSREYRALNFLGMNKRKLVLIDKNKRILWEDESFPLSYTNSNKILKRVKRLIFEEMT
jgi:peroxiredoxin Q/BCP